LPILPWNRSDEENKRISQAEVKQHFAPKRAEPREKLDPAVVSKFVDNLSNPESPLRSDYDRQIIKADARQQSGSSRAPQKTVPQLGEQKKQSCSPLQVFSDTQKTNPPVLDYEQQLQRAADELGVTFIQYLSMVQNDLPTGDEIYQYQYGKSLVRAEEVPHLPTKMRRLHKWYLNFCKTGESWITAYTRDEHFFLGDDQVTFNIEDLYYLYNQKELDKALLSCYCL
jgi:hypothetical protein